MTSTSSENGEQWARSRCWPHVGERAEGAYEHLVDLYEDILGEEPPANAAPADLVAAIREVWEALQRIN